MKKEPTIIEVAAKYVDQIGEISRKKKPLVTIQCCTYNHEPYLRDALEGFVMQQTDFPFVAIVHEDASTDGTAQVLREYAEKYPDIILPIFEKENQYSKGTLTQIMNKACEVTGAKYIAMCEGDDYWIDPLKLQKQVDFLESHPDFGLVHSNVFEADYKNKFLKTKVFRENIPEGDVKKDILVGNFIYTLSVMYRSEFNDTIEKEIDPLPHWDRIMWICLSRITKFHYIPEETGVYRILKNSATHGNIKTVLKTDIIGTSDLLKFLDKNNYSKEEIYSFYVPRSRRLLKYSYLAKDKESLEKYWGIIKTHGIPTLNDKICWAFGRFHVPSLVYKALLKIRNYIS